MMNSTRPLAMAVVALAAAVAAAGAQTPPADPLESAVIRFGPVGINPSLVVRDLGRDDNVFNTPVDPKSDFTFTASPRADIIFHPRGVRVSATTATDLVYYQTYTSERSTNDLLQARVELDLWRFQPFGSISGLDTRARLNQEIDERAHHRERSYTAGLGTRLSTRTTFTVTARRNSLRFDDGETFRGEDLADSLNSRLDAIEGSAGFELTPITTFSLAMSEERQRFDTSVERDSDTFRVTPTLTFAPDGLLSGSASIGYRRFRPKSSAMPAYSGLVATVGLGTTVYGRNRFDATFSRDLRYSYETTTPYYLATGGTLVWIFQVVGPFDVRATGTRQRMDYREFEGVTTATPADTYTAYGGGFGYRLRGNVRLGINAEWSQRDSEISGDRNFHNRRIFASFTWGRPQP